MQQFWIVGCFTSGIDSRVDRVEHAADQYGPQLHCRPRTVKHAHNVRERQIGPWA